MRGLGGRQKRERYEERPVGDKTRRCGNREGGKGEEPRGEDKEKGEIQWRRQEEERSGRAKGRNRRE